MPAQEGKQPNETFPLKLTVKQRDSLLHATRVPTGIKVRIKQTSAAQPVVEFTRKELEKMAEEVYTSLAFAPPADRKRLNAVLDKIDDLLDALEEKRMDEKRHRVDKLGVIYQ